MTRTTDPTRDTEKSRVADCLCLAATPVFATMAVLTVAFGGGMSMICSASMFSLTGMAPMYLLMAAFHAAPWLRLIANRRGIAARPRLIDTRADGDRLPRGEVGQQAFGMGAHRADRVGAELQA